jgi:thiol-disulfide isomerase/thioredoxin
MRFILVTAIAIVFIGCSYKQKNELKPGTWRGVIEIQNNALPFNFKVEKDSLNKISLFLQNAGEQIRLDEVSLEGDSISVTLHIFDSQLKAKIKGDSLNGFFIKNYEKNYRIPFRAAYGQTFRFVNTNTLRTNTPDYTGKYAVTFTNETDTTMAVGIFTQKNSYVEGTFLTPTGDYRYLEGSIINDSLHLSTFDGNHAYLFKAVKKSDGTLVGDYWSGKAWHESWTGVRDETASLPDAESLTYLKEGYNKIDFSFPDIEGNLITPNDQKYKNKVLIIQIMGSWCPNCMDETKFLKDWYLLNKNRGVEILALAYEAKPDFTYASARVKKMKDKLGIPYDIVIAGTKDKAEASKTLPMLNGILAFPTTIFIGKDGYVKKIHSGFSGPGTGVYYHQFVQDFNETVNELSIENVK